MEGKKCCSRRWGHKCCHSLHKKCIKDLATYFLIKEQKYQTTLIYRPTLAVEVVTLNVIMLNKEIFPPEADMTYESFFERAKQGTASSGFVSLISLVISMPLEGCHNCGGTLVVAYK